MAGLSHDKVACMKAAMALPNQTDDEQFLQLGGDMTNLTLAHERPAAHDSQEVVDAMKSVHGIFRVNDEYTLEMAVAAMEACHKVWDDSAFCDVYADPIAMLEMLTNPAKCRIPSSFYCGFLVFFAELAEEYPSLMFVDEENFYHCTDHQRVAKIFTAACRKTGRVYGDYALKHEFCGGDEHIREGITSDWILHQVMKATDAITAESKRLTESEEQAMDVFESLVREFVVHSGQDVPNALTRVCEMQTTRTRQTLETLKTNLEALSQLVNGSINIIKGPGPKDS